MKRYHQFFSAYSLFSRSGFSAIRAARTYKFDGVELFLSGHLAPYIEECVDEAGDAGLKMTFHLWREGGYRTLDKVLRVINYLPPAGYALRDHIPRTAAPTIVYADRAEESLLLEQQCWWETCSACSRGNYVLPYEDFVSLVRKHNARIVFDTQHVLEYISGRPGVEHLSHDPRVLFKRLEHAWEDLHAFVDEIHFNDCNEFGGNLFPGSGRVPLERFSEMVRSTGWSGNIVTEVAPIHLFPHRTRMPILRSTVQSYWPE